MSEGNRPKHRRRLPSLLLALALLTCAAPAPALEPPLQIAQYAHTSWTTRDDPSLRLVFGFAQTPDGYLWMATLAGLFRFDGVRFVRWVPPDGQALPSGPYTLLVSRDGTLWIGTFAGLSSWDGRKFVARYPQIDPGFVTSLLEDRDGTIWAGAMALDATVWPSPERSRLCSIRAGQVQCTGPEGEFGSFIWSLAEDGSGNLWVGTDTGVWRWRPGTARRYPLKSGRVGDLITSADGRLLAGVKGGGLLQMAGDQFSLYAIRSVTKPDEWLADRDIKSNKLLRDRDGSVWIGTEGLGLIHVKDGRADTFTRAEGLSGNVACSLFQDREGNIWYGSERGVDRFRKLLTTTVSKKQGLPDEIVHAVLATRDGSIWVSTNDGLARWKDESPRIYNERDGLPEAHVHSLYEDASGRLWASTEQGLAYFEGGRFVPVKEAPRGRTYAITGDAAGNLWLANWTGLYRWRRGRFVEEVPWSTFDRPRPAQALAADEGGVWLSFWERGGVFHFKDGKIDATYTSGPGLESGRVPTLRLDAEGALWAATSEGGLIRIKDGHVRRLTVADGLPCKEIQASELDAGGSLWLFTGCGLVRIARDDLAAWIADPDHRVTPKRWETAEGIPAPVGGPASFSPPVARGADGRLWYVAGAELAWVALDHMPFNPVPPPVYVENLVADHRPYAVTPDLRLPPLVRDITIQFSALSLVDPKSTRFRYQLEGHDKEWQEVVDKRQATYTNLPPGDYRFRVNAANNSGVWNDKGTQLEFSILPAFYQTAWFRIACAVLLIGLAWGAAQLRLRMRIRRLQQQFDLTLEARVAERTRIARELHDTLLQRFHGLLLQFQAALNLLPDRPRESKQVLASAVERAAEAVTEGRDTVQGLRASTLETNDLGPALSALAEDLANENGQATTARVEVHGTPQALHPLVRDETFRIAGEALRNAFRHAQAQRIDVLIRYDARQLSVRVRDDGTGIDAEVMRSGGKHGHFGLGGMRERAELAGGKLVIRTGPGTGTEVEFSAPGSRAYSRPLPTRSWGLPRMFALRESRE